MRRRKIYTPNLPSNSPPPPTHPPLVDKKFLVFTRGVNYSANSGTTRKYLNGKFEIAKPVLNELNWYWMNPEKLERAKEMAGAI